MTPAAKAVLIFLWIDIALTQMWSEQAILTASERMAGDRFGISVSITDNYALIGARESDTGGYSDAGAAYIFARSGRLWTQQAILTAKNKARGDKFGNSVSLTDSHALVGAKYTDVDAVVDAGAAYVFVRLGTRWVEQTMLTASNAAYYDSFGISTALNGDYALVGADLVDIYPVENAGAVYVFIRSATTWIQQAILTASNKATNVGFGVSVAITTNYALVGAPQASLDAMTWYGVVYVYNFSGTVWNQESILSASDKSAKTFFGWSVALTDNNVIVGGFLTKRSYIFSRSGKVWTEVQSFRYGGGDFGVAMNEKYVMIENYILTRSGSTWGLKTILNRSGTAICISDHYAIIGNGLDSLNGYSNAGESYIFDCPVQDALMRLFTATEGQNWIDKSGWGSSQPVCSWFGVICLQSCTILIVQQNRCPIVEIKLSNNNLQGTLPNLNVPDLTSLDIGSNHISGTLIDFHMPNLMNLTLAHNQLSGTIPNFVTTSNLVHLNISENLFSGNLPLLPASIKSLDISGNDGLFRVRDSLLQLFNTTQGSKWKNHTGWLEQSSYCTWHGIECHPDCTGIQFELDACPLYRINLASNNLVGELPSSLVEYVFQELMEFNISNNLLTGPIPTLNMPKLETLDLSHNMLNGTIPNFFMIELISLHLNDNQLTGTLPNFFMPVLTDISVENNLLTGTIPNLHLPNLVKLSLNGNMLSGTLSNYFTPLIQNLTLSTNRLAGTIPNFSNMPLLKTMSLSNNQLSGTLPGFDMVSKLTSLDISNNNLTGPIPRFVFPDLEFLNLSNNKLNGGISELTIPRLLRLKLGNNKLTGSIPKLLMPLLVELDFKCNSLSGSAPIFMMPGMMILDLSENQLDGELPEFTISQLTHMNMASNKLTGTIPRLSMPKLVSIILSDNQLSGSIPLFESPQLKQIFMDRNNLEGNIPVLPQSVQSLNISGNPRLLYPRTVLSDLYIQMNGNNWQTKTGWLDSNNTCSWYGITCDGNCPTVQSELSLCPITRISLSGNKLSGQLDSGMWLSGLRDLQELNLENNQIGGHIPKIQMPGLKKLIMNRNRLTGNIPDFELPELSSLQLSNNNLAGFSKTLTLRSLTILDFSSNQIGGTLPEFMNLTSLVRLDVSYNRLTAIPGLSLPNLQTLLLFNNQISGSLPDLNLPQLAYLDLSNNNLFKPLPELESLVNIEHFIVSFNQNLTGPLPKGMNLYNKISSVDIKGTRMHTEGDKLLPDTLSPSGQYQMLNPSDNYQCPVLSNSNVSRSNIIVPPEYYDYYNCRCLPGTFGVRNKCINCPSTCSCETGLALIGCFPSPSLQNMETIISCSNPSACKTSIPDGVIIEVSSDQMLMDSCLQGYEGRVCSKCQMNFGAQGRSCVECNSSLVYVSFVVGPVLIICFIIYLYKSEPNASGKLGILIFHTQTLSVIATAMSNTPTVERTVNLPFSVSSIQLPSISCIFETTNAITPVAASFFRLPLFAVVGALAFKFTNGHKRDKVVFVLLNLVRCIYYPIALETFGVFGCTLFDDAYNSWFLNAWPWISCDPISSEYENLLSLAVPTFFIFVCGFPVLLWYLIRDNAHSVNQNREDDERKSRRIRYGFLYLPYKKEYRFWGIVTTGRLLCFGLVVRIVPYTSLAIIFILLLFLMQGSIWLHHLKNPYTSREENAMELISLYTIFFSYFLVLISGFVGNSSWIIGLVIAFNGLVLAFLVWKIIGSALMKLIYKKKVAMVVSSAELPVVEKASSSLSITVEMKNVAPTDS
eukprot:TRINITY_DN3242_c0_g1_i2.p1 TRINITY_DN3242_c0_g1~~TRINITY_DN3242_c0_g1_i2.p1  ORF type:complete len:1755 (+),score=304.09 TRINITY_DN3242_c0_g1_i2:180-5444(+)